MIRIPQMPEPGQKTEATKIAEKVAAMCDETIKKLLDDKRRHERRLYAALVKISVTYPCADTGDYYETCEWFHEIADAALNGIDHPDLPLDSERQR